MTSLFTVDFENNKLYDPGSKGFDFIAVSGGSMAVTTGSKYEGTYGCAVTPLQNYRCGGAKRVNNLTRFRQAFYLHPNAISITSTRYIIAARNYHNDESQRIYAMYLGYTTGTGYTVQFSVDINTEAAYWSSSAFVLENQTGWNLIETDWYANDTSGFFKVWINGGSGGNPNWNRSLVNGQLRINYPALGAMSQVYAVSGSFYIDYWRANNDGTLIGA